MNDYQSRNQSISNNRAGGYPARLPNPDRGWHRLLKAVEGHVGSASIAGKKPKEVAEEMQHLARTIRQLRDVLIKAKWPREADLIDQCQLNLNLCGRFLHKRGRIG